MKLRDWFISKEALINERDSIKRDYKILLDALNREEQSVQEIINIIRKYEILFLQTVPKMSDIELAYFYKFLDKEAINITNYTLPSLKSYVEDEMNKRYMQKKAEES